MADANSQLSGTPPEDEEHWISVSDLMSGLMVIFLFVAIAFLRPLQDERDTAERGRNQAERMTGTVRQIVGVLRDTERALNVRLASEFERDLQRWGAELDRSTLTIRFRAPEVLFEPGRAALRPGFEGILREFIPRYLSILVEYRDEIDEVRIEGHTSSEWTGATSNLDAYFRNMSLSQDRTRAVLEFCLTRTGLAVDRVDWARGLITANGLSSSRLRLREDGTEDREISRRVEFRVVTKSRERLLRILEAVGP